MFVLPSLDLQKPIPGGGGLQLIVYCQPARSGEGYFSGCVAKLFFWLCRQVAFLAGSKDCFSGCVERLFFCLCRQVVFLAVSPDCLSGCVARLFFWLCRQVCYWLCRQVVSGWFCQGSFSDVRQCVIVLAILAVWSRDSPGQGQSIIEQVK